MAMPNFPFIGSEAVASGAIRKHELRARYRVVFPDVYVPKNAELTLPERAKAAWLYSHREGIVAGLTASGLHGAKWADDREGMRTRDHTQSQVGNLNDEQALAKHHNR
jgi:hypothetical protein